MARLSDLVNVNINRNKITIQGVEIPVIFTFESFPYIEEVYGEEYTKFETELRGMLKTGEVSLGEKEIKLMNCLIYAMIRSGGTEATYEEVRNSIPIHDLPGIFQVVYDLFSNQTFQQSDMEKIKQEKKSE